MCFPKLALDDLACSIFDACSRSEIFKDQIFASRAVSLNPSALNSFESSMGLLLEDWLKLESSKVRIFKSSEELALALFD